MFGRLRRGGAIAAALALAIVGAGATPALADPEDTYVPSDAMLTKVIDAAAGTDASGDKYVFHFAGGGTVADGDTSAGESSDGIYSDGVAQDTTTLKVGDVVPTINDVELNGYPFTNSNTRNNGQTAQGAVQKPISDILNGVTFPHAGVYTYIVTESAVQLGANNASEGIYISASQAEYTLRVYVSNTNTGDHSELGDRNVNVTGVTIEQTKDDNGNPTTGKVNPTFPTMDPIGKIDKVSVKADENPGEGELAGNERGREVPGFTFANEYIKGGAFTVKKLYDGDHSDRTKYSTVRLVVYSEAATSPDSQGCVLTYEIKGEGIDKTDNKYADGARVKLNGINTNIEQLNHYMVKFDNSGYAVIEADLKEDSYIRITGEFGPYKEEFANDPRSQDGNMRMIISTSGLVDGQEYWVIERNPGDYRPTGYIYEGDDGNVDPRTSLGAMKMKTVVPNLGDNIGYTPDPTDHSDNPAEIYSFGLLVNDHATGSATTVFVVNTMDESKVSVTGILIENLPYILMVGGPLAIFALMFVSKRRRNAAA